MTVTPPDRARAERLDEVDDALDDAVLRLGNLGADREISEALEERRERPRDAVVARMRVAVMRATRSGSRRSTVRGSMHTSMRNPARLSIV